MVSSFNSYPKVHNLGHPEVKEIFDDEVYIEEKIDGSQVSAHIDQETGELRMRSRGREFPPDAADKLFQGVTATFLSLKDRMVHGWTYRGESIETPRHNHLAYERVPFGNVVLYDVVGHDAEDYLGRGDVEASGKDLGLEVAPLLMPPTKLDVKSREQLAEILEGLLKADPLLGGEMIEGVVIKSTGRFGRDGKPLMAKYVSPKFREEQRVSWKESNPGAGDIVQIIIQMLRSEARWGKAVEHLRDDGRLEGSPRDIGALIKEVQRDVAEECSELIAQKFLKWGLPRILRGVTGGVASWYKEELINDNFR